MLFKLFHSLRNYTFVALLCASLMEAKVTLPQLFQSGMVLQRGKVIPVWGKADAGEVVTIQFNKKQYTVTADAEGKWRIDLPKMKAGGPYQLTVGELVIDNVMIGDVWLLSGQSNIDVHIERVYPQYAQSALTDVVLLLEAVNEALSNAYENKLYGGWYEEALVLAESESAINQTIED